MTKAALHGLSDVELVKQFESLALRQHQANFEDDTPTFNKIYTRMTKIVNELRSRPGDQRRVLVPLLAHANAWVRYKAAVNTLVVAPGDARVVLEQLALKSNNEFATAYARGTVQALDKGTFPLK
jgi:hypothetical protein